MLAICLKANTHNLAKKTQPLQIQPDSLLNNDKNTIGHLRVLKSMYFIINLRAQVTYL